MSGGGQDQGHNDTGHTLHNIMAGMGVVDSTLGVAEGLLSSPIGHGLHHTLEHAAPNLMPGLGAFLGPLGFLNGGAETAMGVNQLAHGDLNGLTTGAKGVAGMVGGGASALGALAGTGGTALGVSGAAAAEGAMFTTATGAIAAAPVAAVAGAAGAGLAIGSGMSAASDSSYTRTGFWGKNEAGGNNSAMDAAVDVGLDYDRRHGVKPGDWSVPGAALSAGAGIVNGVAGTAQAGWNASGLGGLWDRGAAAVGRGAASAGQWLNDGVNGIYNPPR